MRTVNDRLTAYAIITALESDARAVIRDMNSDDSLGDLFTRAQLRESAVGRAASEEGIDIVEASIFPPSELLNYIDFGDAAKLLHMTFAGTKLPKDVGLLASSIDDLARARKRVAHSRRLRREDLPKTLSALEALAKVREFRFDEIKRVFKQLSDRPEYVLGLEIPPSRDEHVLENLPVSDYDETGLIGRENDVKQLGKLLRAPHRPVVSIVGEGGIGKSAIALEVLNEIVDDPEMPFKAVVWCSLKTHGFGAAGVRQLHSELITTLTPLRTFQEQLGLSISDQIDELVDFLTLFPTVLVIDNLETINAGAIRQLVEAVPPESKLLLTSRVGLGEFEVRYPVGPLPRTSSIQLLRSLATLLNAQSLKQKSHAELGELCDRLNDTPLALKWITGAVANGASIAEAMRNRGDLLKYCFESIYDTLSALQIQILQAFQSTKRPLSGAELQYFVSASDSFDEELNKLRLTSMLHVSTEKASGKAMFSLGDAAADFLAKFHSVQTDTYLSFIAKEKELSLNEQRAVMEGRHDFNPLRVNVDPTDKDSLIASIYLKEAVNAFRRRETDKSEEMIEQAKRLYAESIEAYRISAVLFAERGELAKADSDFQVALSLAEARGHEDPVLFYSISDFYLRKLQSRFVEALDFAERALRIDKQGSTITNLARAQLYTGQYDEVINTCEEILANEKRTTFSPRTVSIAFGYAVEACRRSVERCMINADPKAFAYATQALSFLERSMLSNAFDGTLSLKSIELMRQLFRALLEGGHWARDYDRVLTAAIANRALFALAPGVEIDRLVDQLIAVCGSSELFPRVQQFIEAIRRPEFDPDALRGIIHNYITEKKFGFITLDGGEQIYFHRSAVRGPLSLTNLSGLSVRVKLALEEPRPHRRASEVWLDR